MKVKDLIKELEKLPKNATIGTIDINDVRLSQYVPIKTKEDTLIDCIGEEISIERIEKKRLSNKSKICDYYIG